MNMSILEQDHPTAAAALHELFVPIEDNTMDQLLLDGHTEHYPTPKSLVGVYAVYLVSKKPDLVIPDTHLFIDNANTSEDEFYAHYESTVDIYRPKSDEAADTAAQFLAGGLIQMQEQGRLLVAAFTLSDLPDSSKKGAGLFVNNSICSNIGDIFDRTQAAVDAGTYTGDLGDREEFIDDITMDSVGFLLRRREDFEQEDLDDSNYRKREVRCNDPSTRRLFIPGNRINRRDSRLTQHKTYNPHR